MSINLYLRPASAPCRAVLLVASALGIQDKIKVQKLNMLCGDHLKPPFTKLNPQHTIPTIVDNGFTLWESRAICRYLVNKYGGPNNSLYPTDAKARAVVDQRLDFELGTLYSSFTVHFYSQFMGGKSVKGTLQKLQDALGFLNTFLEGQTYVAGDNLTIADLSLVALVSSIDATGIDLKEYPNIFRWYEFMKTTAPDYIKANEEPLEEFKEYLCYQKVPS